jgi:hypothetical protein
MLFLIFFTACLFSPYAHAQKQSPSPFDKKVNDLRHEKPHLFQPDKKPNKKSTSSLFTYKNACRAVDLGALCIGLYRINRAYHLIYDPVHNMGSADRKALENLSWIVGTSVANSLQAAGNHAAFAKTAGFITLEMIIYEKLIKMGLYCGKLVINPVKKIMGATVALLQKIVS